MQKTDVIQNWTILYSLAVDVGPIVSLGQVGCIALAVLSRTKPVLTNWGFIPHGRNL